MTAKRLGGRLECDPCLCEPVPRLLVAELAGIIGGRIDLGEGPPDGGHGGRRRPCAPACLLRLLASMPFGLPPAMFLRLRSVP